VQIELAMPIEGALQQFAVTHCADECANYFVNSGYAPA
jgi:hypothetical protein